MTHSTQNRSFWSQYLGMVDDGMEKLNLTQQKHIFTNQKKYRTTQNKKKLKSALVTSYDIRPGNGEGLLWFRRFIKCHLFTYLRHLPTYLQDPQRQPFQTTSNQGQLSFLPLVGQEMSISQTVVMLCGSWTK